MGGTRKVRRGPPLEGCLVTPPLEGQACVGGFPPPLSPGYSVAIAG